MPRRDGTGPDGNGPKSGRGMGKCGKGQGRQVGSGQGMGLGRQNRFRGGRKRSCNG